MKASAAVFIYALCATACSRSSPPPEARSSAGASSPSAGTAAPVASSPASPVTSTGTATTKVLSVSSPAFDAGGVIPKAHTCEGGDQSPPLVIGRVPDATQSLALVLEDPDAPDPAAPKRVWAHWVVYDLPATTRSLAAGAGNSQKLGHAGKNDWGSTGYRGPCPPVGRHRYLVRVYAVDRLLGDLHEPSKSELLQALEGHVVARGELMGTYQKSQ